MRERLLPALPVLLLALTGSTASAQTALQLRWELEEDVFQGAPGVSRAAFTLTNRDAKPLGPTGWAIYFNALHQPQAGSVAGGFTIENVTGDLHRLVPGAGFAGLTPGASVRIPYLTELLVNVSFAPNAPYIVWEAAKDRGSPRRAWGPFPCGPPPQGAGRDPRVLTPQDQFALDSVIR